VLFERHLYARALIPLPSLPQMVLTGLLLKFGFDAHSSVQTKSRDLTDLIGQGADRMLEVQSFQYIVQNEAGETMGGYTSTDEPPVKGDVIGLEGISDWDSAEVLGVTMMLSKHYNQVVLKVRPADAY
jgi:hypothetical protein